MNTEQNGNSLVAVLTGAGGGIGRATALKLAQQGIYPIVMKGMICRQLYGDLGEHRPSSDEDILVEIKDFYKVQEILEKEGYV